MLHIVTNPYLYIWEATIAQLIHREADYHSLGDTSLHAAGGFSLDLGFWWYISWHNEIQSRTLKSFTVQRKIKNTDEFISINLLEFAVVIINYAAASLALSLSSSCPANPY